MVSLGLQHRFNPMKTRYAKSSCLHTYCCFPFYIAYISSKEDFKKYEDPTKLSSRIFTG